MIETPSAAALAPCGRVAEGRALRAQSGAAGRLQPARAPRCAGRRRLAAVGARSRTTATALRATGACGPARCASSRAGRLGPWAQAQPWFASTIVRAPRRAAAVGATSEGRAGRAQRGTVYDTMIYEIHAVRSGARRALHHRRRPRPRLSAAPPTGLRRRARAASSDRHMTGVTNRPLRASPIAPRCKRPGWCCRARRRCRRDDARRRNCRR